MIITIKQNIKRIPFLLKFYHLIKPLRQDDISYNINEQYPWKTPLSERINLLHDQAKLKKIIIFLYPEEDITSFRYRGYNICQIINSTKDWFGVSFNTEEIDAILDNISLINKIIFFRVPWSEKSIKLIEKAKIKNIHIAYDLDDYVIDVDYVPEIIKQLSFNEGQWGGCFGYVSMRYLLASQFDQFITTNEFLARKIRNKFKKKVYVIPNFVNKEQVEISKKSIKNVTANDSEFIIGYASGTKTHNKDFITVEDSLIRIMEKFTFVKLMIIGQLDLSKKFNKFNERIIKYGIQDYKNLQIYIANFNLNLIPLVINDYTNAKSELKFFEAGLVKTPSIASPTFVYKKNIRDGINGFIANTDEEWYSKMEKLILDRNYLTKIGGSAYKYSIENYYGKKINKLVINTYLKLI